MSLLTEKPNLNLFTVTMIRVQIPEFGLGPFKWRVTDFDFKASRRHLGLNRPASPVGRRLERPAR